MMANANWIPTPAKSAPDRPFLELCCVRFSSSILGKKVTACEDFHKRIRAPIPKRGRRFRAGRKSKTQAELVCDFTVDRSSLERYVEGLTQCENGPTRPPRNPTHRLSNG